MPTMVVEEPLGVVCVFSDGSRAEFALDALPNPRLARDLALGLVELIHPHGSVDAAGSVGHYARSLSRMVHVLAQQGFSGGAGDLRRGQLAQFWMAGPTHLEAMTRSLVEGFARAGGVLGTGVLELAAGRHFNIQPNRQPLPPYPEAEWERLGAVCRALVEESYAAHRKTLTSVAGARHPAEGGWTVENFCWLLARTGPIGTPDFARALGVTAAVFRNRGGAVRLYQAMTSVFPHLDTLIAYRLLFGIYSGIVPDGIADLGVGDVEWAGDCTVLLSYVKGRTAAESLNLPRPAVRLLERWLAHSALLRSLVTAPERDKLWLGLSQVGNARLVREVDRVAVQRWVRRFGVAGEDGQPMKVHRARIRTTHHAMRERSGWSGSARATIDPNHTPAVEGDHYLTATTPAQRHAVETIMEDAQHDILRRAHPPTVITEEDAAALAEDYPQLVARLGLDDAAIAELVGGERDVFTAACGDQLSGLHGPAGKPCPARPWVCLLCPLAVFAPRHAANLLRLKAFFSRQWQQMPAAHFMAVFGPYAARIDQVLERFDPAGLTAAAAEVSHTDEQIPLRPEEHTA
ncbi:hypothetical protein KGA66_12240 [Actinocrinis puniceicyclus]|uniref:Uncharacterized protein n=1 Tax=Actinocrinis puniceicyclus TaxID=977794 RepID=A0A8J7WK92_9ACTN|nr:hypothetical protein [Actinocrinis puniceicyclus]MBS2963821.1 hypothetical protein [Actinocrinis puniceicyclus]